ncbi:MAG: hypothetical protein ABJ327_18275 [Litoreibacter sp.]
MKPLHIVTSLAICAATNAAFAHDLSNVKTDVMLGLTGPTSGAKLKPVVVATQPLEAEGIAELAGRSLRTRFWSVGGPDGIVPIHSHVNRPAVFTVATGEIFEYSSLAEKPFLHKTGGLAMEAGGSAHWWHNAGSETVYLIAFDVQPVADDYGAVEVSATPAATSFDKPAAKDSLNELLGAVDLGEHFDHEYGTGWVLSTYRATIEPGGILPDFTGAGEPLQAFVWTGEVQEHRSDVETAVTLAERSGSNLGAGATAYWENTGDVAAEVYFGVIEPLSEVADLKRVGVLAHGKH